MSSVRKPGADRSLAQTLTTTLEGNTLRSGAVAPSNESSKDLFDPTRPVATPNPVASTAPGHATGTLAVDQIRALEGAEGRRLTVTELAQQHPSARVNGVGLTLAELSERPLGIQRATGETVTLGDATIDRNGDLDVTPLLRGDLVHHHQNLLLRKGDELPQPLSEIIEGSAFLIGNPAHAARLAGSPLARVVGHPVVHMHDMEQVELALRSTGLDPNDAAAVQHELHEAGVSTPLSRDDQLRRVLLKRMDHPSNVLDIDDYRVKWPDGPHNAGVRPTVYASAKVHPGKPDHVVLTYKRFNNQSFAGQGWWTTKLLGKDRASQHEFDSEAMMVKLKLPARELETLLAVRHNYAERYDADEVEAVKRRTGREDLTTSVSYKAHGSELAERKEQNLWAGHGHDGVRFGHLVDFIIKDKFPGLDDVARGKAIFIRKDDVDLVMECDDRQCLDLRVQFGAHRKGLFGTPLLDIFNDGGPVDRFGGTNWFFEQEALNNRE